MSVSSLRPGDVYRLKEGAREYTYAQIGMGGDVGFFRALQPSDVCDLQPLFRVVVNQRDFKRHWIKVGNFSSGNSLRELAWYGDSEIGREETYQVRLDALDARTPVDDQAYQGLERLAVWYTTHILQRLASIEL